MPYLSVIVVISGFLFSSHLIAQVLTDDLYILAGQSNASGHGKVEDIGASLGATIPGVFIWQNTRPNGAGGRIDRLRLGQNTVQFPQNIPSLMDAFGPELGLAQSYRKEFPQRRMLLLKYAKGGTSLINPLDWNPQAQNQNLFDGMMSEIDQLASRGQSGRLRCLIWVQGEADRGRLDPLRQTPAQIEQQIQSYQNLMLRLKDQVKDRLNSPKARLVLVQLSQKRNPDDLSSFHPDSRAATKNFRRMQAELVRNFPEIRWVTGTDALAKHDPVHYTSAALMTLGRKIFEACHSR